MDGPAKLPRWSASALGTFERCPERYRRRYVERERGPGSLPMVVGAAVHAAARLDNRSRLTLDVRAPARELVDAAVAEYDACLAREAVDAPARERGEGRDGAAAGARGWAAEVSPRLLRPVAAEEKIEADAGGFRLVGVLDYVVPHGDGTDRFAGAVAVRDLKTGRRPGADAAARSSQLTFYGLLWRARSGEWPAAVALDHLAPPAGARPGATWRRDERVAARGPGDYAALFERLRRAQAAVAAGIFPAAAEHEATCSAKWCEFWRDCPLVPTARRGLAEGGDA